MHNDDAERVARIAAQCGIPMEEFFAVAVYRYAECVVNFREAPPGSGVKISLDQLKLEQNAKQPEGKECA